MKSHIIAQSCFPQMQTLPAKWLDQEWIMGSRDCNCVTFGSNQRAIFINEHPNVWFALAEAQRALKDRNAAKQSYEQCLRLDPHHGRAIVGLELVQ